MSGIMIAGCGDIGIRLGLLLCADGHQVFGVRRRYQHIPAPIQALAADIVDPQDAFAVIAPSVSQLVFVATADNRDEASYRRTCISGFIATRDALLVAGAPLQRALYASSTSVYGQCNGEWVDETTDPAPNRMNGRVLLEAEAVVQDGTVPGCIVRFGGIYGPNRHWLIDQVRSKKLSSQSAYRYTNRFHCDDCAGVLQYLLSLKSPQPVYVAVDDAPTLQWEVMHWIADRLGVVLPLPPTTTDLNGNNRGKRCRNTRLRADGYRLRYPTYRDGYDATLKQVGHLEKPQSR